MKHCSKCGADSADNAAFCESCGAPLEMAQQQAAPQQPAAAQAQPAANPADKGGFGWGLLGFCIPLAGLILFLVWKGEKPKTAKAAGIGALVSVIISVVFYVIAAIAGVAVGV